MIQDITAWLDELTQQMKEAFGARLRYIGHTGSYARGEASARSDIDVNVVLDELHTKDLARYCGIIRGMPHSEKACGFICGRAEMAAWPKIELFQFMFGSRTLYGSLEGIAAPPDDHDIAEHIRIAASAIYHETGHRYIYGEDHAEEAEQLVGAYKTAFFVLQEQVYLRERRYIPTHKALRDYLSDDEKEVLDTGMNWDALRADRQAQPERFFDMLLRWSSAALRGAAEGSGQ